MKIANFRICFKYMYRFFEMVPGLLAWGTIILMFILSWFVPAGAAIFIILFDTYWLLKIIYLSFHLRATFKKMRENLKINWLDKLTNNQPRSAPPFLRKERGLRGKQSTTNNWQDVYHLIILPMFKEPYEVVKETFEGLLKANYPKDKFIVALGIEEKAGEPAQKTARKIQAEFGDKFFRFLITRHPANLPGEIPGKGSNQTWAAREVKKLIIDPLKIHYENILVSVFDVDTQVLPEYFGILTYSFLTCEYPQNSSFQPIPLFTNNIFQAPALARVIAFSSTFWHMMQQSRP